MYTRGLTWNSGKIEWSSKKKSIEEIGLCGSKSARRLCVRLASIRPLSTTPTCSLADTHPAGAMHRAPAQCFIYSLMRVAAIAIFRVGGHCGLHARASPLPRTKNNPPPVCTIIIAFTSHAKWANKRDSTVLRSRTQSGNNAVTSSQPSSRVVARDDLTHCLSVVKLYCGTTERDPRED